MENNQKDNPPKKINWKLEARRYSFEPRYKFPKSFLYKIDSDQIFEKEKSLNNYCEIIAKSKANIKVFKINLIINLLRMILNIILVILAVCFWSIKNTIIENEKIFFISFIVPILLICLITNLSYEGSAGFGFIGFYKGTNFNNYVIHREYLRCKLAILINKQNENNNLDKIRKYFEINAYKFLDDEKIKISDNIKIKNKYDSSLIKWFNMTGWIIIDVIFQLGSIIATVLTIVFEILIK